MDEENFKTTAIYENRILDRKELLSQISLVEFGDNDTLFSTKDGLWLCRGYDRIVFGDHGPYIEFNKRQVMLDNWTCTRIGVGYYDQYYPKNETSILLYAQRRDVSNLPNPPKGKRSYMGNRQEGYADYVVGKFYISPYELWLRITKDGKVLNETKNNLSELIGE